jgi:D-glycero-D-manno-heptose 1,7-bisphosphate phosphatase
VKQRAVFLDRDGTLIRDIPYAHRAADLHLLDNAVAGLRSFVALGFKLIVVTNQSGIGRGYFTEEDMRHFHEALEGQLRAEGVELTAIYYCPYHPTAGIGPYRRPSELRKPGPGMLLRAERHYDLDLAASYMIGDRERDIVAGQAAGCHTILVRDANGAIPADLNARPDFIAPDLLAAARFIERNQRPASAVPRPAHRGFLPLTPTLEEA